MCSTLNSKIQQILKIILQKTQVFLHLVLGVKTRKHKLAFCKEKKGKIELCDFYCNKTLKNQI